MHCKSAARRGNCVTNQSRSQCNQHNCLPAKKRMLRCKAFIHKCSKTFSIAWTKRTRRFFRRGHDFPRFKGKGWFDSFPYPQLGFRVEGSQVSLAKIGNVKIHLHRPLAGDIKTLTLKHENGKWYACFSCMVDSEGGQSALVSASTKEATCQAAPRIPLYEAFFRLAQSVQVGRPARPSCVQSAQRFSAQSFS